MSTAVILKSTPQSVAECGKLLAAGKLVAFPTETVYGLGANALDFGAVLRIYETKQRPLSDPVIVHVSTFESSLPLIKPSDKELQIYRYLAETFWPGPLTLVVRHSELIHPSMAANSGYVGIRLPNHSLATQLIAAAGVPIAAPSANMFNHVSPTTAAHVFNDFFDKDVTILDEGNATLGIESTVVKVSEDRLTVFRLGSLPKTRLEEALAQNPLTRGMTVEEVKKMLPETAEVIAPGMYVKHYSPKVPAYVLTDSERGESAKKRTNFIMSTACLIDLGGKHEALAPFVRRYFDLSPSRSLQETMFRLYFLLREAEDVVGCDVIFVVDLLDYNPAVLGQPEYLDCIQDKIFRACSGQYVTNVPEVGEKGR